MKWLFTFVASTLLLTTPIHADDSKISFATVNWEPYAGEALNNYGLSTVIIKEACKRVGLTPSFHFMPWNRAMAQTRDGKYDAVYNAYFSKERAEHYAISEPYFRTILTLCTTIKQSINYDGSVESLKPYRLGLVRGFVNTEEIDQASYLKKDTAETDVLNLRKLLHGRVDMIVIDKYQAIHLVKNNPTIEADIRDIRFITPILEEKTLHVLFSKEKPDWLDKLKRFNKGIMDIQADGTLNDIMFRFGFFVPHKE